nr:hypothetical protein [Tanacetum cinerariifolium]
GCCLGGAGCHGGGEWQQVETVEWCGGVVVVPAMGNSRRQLVMELRCGGGVVGGSSWCSGGETAAGDGVACRGYCRSGH